MATRPRLDPRLTAAVERARQEAALAGELTPPAEAFEACVPAEVGVVIHELLRDGTYAAAVARVTTDPRDLRSRAD